MKPTAIRQAVHRTSVSALVCSLMLFSSLASLIHGQEEPPPPQEKDLTPFQQALLNYRSGHFEEARAAVDIAEKAKPGDPATEILKARILTELGEYAAGEKILRTQLTPTGPLEVELALGDLFLRKRDFSSASKYYDLAALAKPNDPDITLKMIYSRIGATDLITAEKEASHLKPLDADHPSYYFAKAALAQATGKTEAAEEDIQTARTIYGITVANHYLKTYLEVFAAPDKSVSTLVAPPATNAPPAQSK